jgi:hypothetical protein
VVGEYVYFLEDVLTYPQDQPKADQSNQKLGDAVAIAEDVILVDKHVTLQTKLYRVSKKPEQPPTTGFLYHGDQKRTISSPRLSAEPVHPRKGCFGRPESSTVLNPPLFSTLRLAEIAVCSLRDTPIGALDTFTSFSPQ